MLWEELSAVDFDGCVQKSDGVCVLPMGVLEKHGDHLPLGTDMYIGTAVAKRAAEISPATVFPYYFLGQIAEARHARGTLAASHTLIMDALLEMCDEVYRNGFTKILLLSSHGGNEYLLPFFAQRFPGLNRPYAVYTRFLHSLSAEQLCQIQEHCAQTDMGEHGGFYETSLMMHLRPELVHLETQKASEGIDMRRLEKLRSLGVFTGFDWYAQYPHHIAGDPSSATAIHGKYIFDLLSENIARVLDEIKADQESLKLIAEYNQRAQ